MTTKGMTQMSELAPTFGEALAEVQDALHDARRSLSGTMMTKFPEARWMRRRARRLAKTLNAGSVEFNAITDDEQVTICDSSKAGVTAIPVEHSLCVIAASAGVAIAVDDVRAAGLLTDHPVTAACHSWASYPVFVNGVSAGTVCALEPDKPRRWTLDDQAALKATADELGARIARWLQT